MQNIDPQLRNLKGGGMSWPEDYLTVRTGRVLEAFSFHLSFSILILRHFHFTLNFSKWVNQLFISLFTSLAGHWHELTRGPFDCSYRPSSCNWCPLLHSRGKSTPILLEDTAPTRIHYMLMFGQIHFSIWTNTTPTGWYRISITDPARILILGPHWELKQKYQYILRSERPS